MKPQTDQATASQFDAVPIHEGQPDNKCRQAVDCTVFGRLEMI